MSKVFNISFTRLAVQLTPTVLRRPLVMAMFSAFMRPLDMLWSEFLAWRDSLKTSLPAQTCYLQSIINDEFDYYQRRIIIRNLEITTDDFLLWRESLNKPIMLPSEASLGEVFLLNRNGQTGANTDDFEVVLPAIWYMSPSDIYRLKQLVDENKLVSKKYVINYE